MIKIVILLAEMYLAAAILNAIQVCRVFKSLTGGLPITLAIEGFSMYLTDPIINVQGVWRAFHDWYWLDKRVYIDEDGEFRLHEMEDA